MSHQDFVGFVHAINTDPVLQERVASIGGTTMEDRIAAFIDMGGEAGYVFSEQEMDELFLARAASEAGEELSPEALESVAGGILSSGALSLGSTEMTEMNKTFDLEYMQLLQNMQQENRQFTMVSNIMKTKHDTAKAAINNVR